MNNSAEKLLKACNDQSAQSRSTWLTFLLLGTYLAVTVGSTTHKQLLLEAPVALPLLGVTLPTIAFFRFAPCLFVLTHFFMLVQLYLLSRTLHTFNAALREDNSSASTELALRTQLDSFSVTQLVAGVPTDWAANLFVKLSCWITLLIAPILLLLEFQVQFLAYHDVGTTYIHRAAIIVDLLICWLLWPAIILPGGGLKALWQQAVSVLRRKWDLLRRRPARQADSAEGEEHSSSEEQTSSGPASQSVAPATAVTLRAVLRLTAIALIFGLSLAVASFSLFLATIPGETLETWTANLVPDLESTEVRKICGLSSDALTRTQPLRPLVCLGSLSIWHGARSTVNDAHLATNGLPAKWRVWWPTVVLFEGSLPSDRDERDRLNQRFAKNDRLSIAHKNQQPGNLFARNLTVASSIQTQSPKAKPDSGQKLPDDIRELSLSHRDLRFARLRDANLRGVDLTGADLTGADLTRANLQNAIIVIATSARFIEANLKGAKLDFAWLQGAAMQSSDMTDTRARSAHLQGANLTETSANDADFSDADLRASSLQGLNLSGANLIRTNLSGSDLSEADLSQSQYALKCDDLRAADLRNASLYGTELNCANGSAMRSVNLRDVSFKPPTDDSESPAARDQTRRRQRQTDKSSLAAAKKTWESYLSAKQGPAPAELHKALVDIACNSHADAFAAVGIVSRLEDDDLNDRAFSKIVAKLILEGTCPPAALMSRANVERLKRVAQ